MAESKQMRSPIKILIVEDSDLLRGIFKTALSAEHLIEGAATVKEGWEMFLEYAPNIVFLDITLPDGSGHDLAYRIKARAPKTYIVMATASDYTDDKEEAAFNRADGYLTKPFGKHEIDSVIERYWSSRT